MYSGDARGVVGKLYVTALLPPTKCGVTVVCHMTPSSKCFGGLGNYLCRRERDYLLFDSWTGYIQSRLKPL